MAKANDNSSTIDWVWLRDALKLAISCFGSVALAKALLIEWLATGKSPWSCTAFRTLDAQAIAALENAQSDGMIPFRYIPSSLREGDPEFWRADLTIDWENNIAYENSDVGPTALGIKLSREHILALLHAVPRERIELGRAHPAERELLEPKVRSASTAVSKKTSPQSERAKRYIPVHFPDGVDGIPTEVIYKKLASDAKLKAELGGRAPPSHTVINRVIGRRKV